MSNSNANAAAGAKRSRRRRKQSYLDYNLLAVVILLSTFGLVMLYSASSYEALSEYGTDVYFLTRQGAYFVLAIIAALLVSLVDYHILVRTAPLWYFGALGLMAVVKVAGRTSHGAARWLEIGPISFQPAEIAKIAVILTMASMIVSFGRNIGYKRNLFWLIAASGILFLAAYKLTNNLSTGIIILAIGLGLIFVYYPKFRHLLFILLVVVALAALALLYVYFFVDLSETDSFRILRILSFLDQDSSSSEGSYQVIQGLYAIGSGGFFGKGLGNSTQKINRIPEAQNDMIFSIICEELGLFGAIILLILFGYLLYRLYFIAQNAPDLYGSIIATGVLIHFALQIVLNLAVVTKMIPTTGISLPFVSYGGTAVMFLMGEIGICLNISRQIRFTGTKKNS